MQSPLRVPRSVLVAATLSSLACIGPAATAGEDAASVTVTLEVWAVTGAEATKQLESITDENPADAKGVRDALQRNAKAKRLSRFVTPTSFGTPMKHSDQVERAFQTSPPKGARAAIGGFGGFSQEGTKVTMTATQAADGRVKVALDLQTSSSGTPRQLPDGTVIPGDRVRAAVAGSVQGPSGTARVFCSQSADGRMIVVWIKPTIL